MAVLAIGALRTAASATTRSICRRSPTGGAAGVLVHRRGGTCPVVLAWAAGSVFRVLAVNTTLYVGPLADIASGVDLSTVGSAVIAAVVYAVAGNRSGSPGEQLPVGQPLVDIA